MNFNINNYHYYYYKQKINIAHAYNLCQKADSQKHLKCSENKIKDILQQQ